MGENSEKVLKMSENWANGRKLGIKSTEMSKNCKFDKKLWKRLDGIWPKTKKNGSKIIENRKKIYWKCMKIDR